MKKFWQAASFSLCLAVSAFGWAAPTYAAPPRILSAAQTAAPLIVNVDCANGQTIADALTRGQGLAKLEIRFSGVCRERVLIERDGVTVRGVGADPVLNGAIDIHGAKGVTIRDFLIHARGIPSPGLDTGAVTVTKGSAAVLLNLKVEDLPRGIRVVGGKAEIQNVTIERTRIAFEFLIGWVKLDGTIAASDSVIGMFVLSTGVMARADLSFNNNVWGVVVELSSSLTHFAGHLTATGNQIGVLLAGQGTYAFASFVDIRDNLAYGLVVEELSNISAFRGAPGGGPTVSITGNPVGISATRGATLDLIGPTVVTGNGIGLEVEESQARLEGISIHDNSTGDMKLGFAARATFIGDSNSLGSPMQCHETALVRGSLVCGAPLSSAAIPAASASLLIDGLTPRELLSRILQ